MAMEIYSREAQFDRLRVTAAASVGNAYVKTGYAVASDAAEASTTSTNIKATAHSAAVGDQIIITSGTRDGEVSTVTEVATNDFTVSPAFSGAPSATDTFNIIRPISIDAANSGQPIKQIIFRSTLNQTCYISFDGSTDHLAVPASSDFTLDMKANGLHLSSRYVSGSVKCDYIYVKVESTAPSSGSLYIMALK